MGLKFKSPGAEIRAGMRFGKILADAEVLSGYTERLTPEQFASDQRIQDAISMRLFFIGNALRNILGTTLGCGPNGLIRNYPEVKWGELKKMEPLVYQDYTGSVLEKIWKKITVDLPEMIAAINDIATKHSNFRQALAFSKKNNDYARQEATAYASPQM